MHGHCGLSPCLSACHWRYASKCNRSFSADPLLAWWQSQICHNRLVILWQSIASCRHASRRSFANPNISIRAALTAIAILQNVRVKASATRLSKSAAFLAFGGAIHRHRLSPVVLVVAERLVAITQRQKCLYCNA